MALNLSDADLKLYFDANTAVNISIFTFLILPPFLLCLLCVLALVLAKDINLKIRLLLINIFTAETLYWFSFFVMYLGWPARFINEDVISCQLFNSLYTITNFLKLASTSLYAVGVYTFIKHGDKKLKWYVIITYIAVTWTVATLSVSLPSYLEDYGTPNLKEFCYTEELVSGLLIGMSVLFFVGAMFFFSIQLIWCILTVIYMKRNVLEGDIPVKKAIAKVLGHMTAVSVLSFISLFLPPFIAFIFITLPDRNLATFLVGIYVTYVFANITAFPTPIVAIILLKPVRDAIRTMSKNVYTCCHKNRECSATTEDHPRPATGITSQVSLANTKKDSNNIGNYIACTNQNLAATEVDLDSMQVSTTDENHAM